MAVTLRDVAAHIGLSRPTVTRILGGDTERFHPETCDRVRKAAAELGYRPNAAARAIGTGRFACAALLLGHDLARSDFPMPLLYGLQDELSKHDMHLTITRLPDEELTKDGVVPKVLRQNVADGMIVNYTHGIPARMLELIQESSAPSVWVNTDLAINCVHPDDIAGPRMLVDRMLSLGHRRIAYLNFGTSTHYSASARVEGYAAAVMSAGVKPVIVGDDGAPARQPELTRRLLTSRDRPTAIIIRPEDASTVAYVAASLGMRIPQDLSVGSISGYAFRMLGMIVTAVIVPAYQEGQTAVRMLLERLKKPSRNLPSQSVPFEWFEGVTIVAPSI